MELEEFIKKLKKIRSTRGNRNVIDDQVRITSEGIEFYKEGDNPF